MSRDGANNFLLENGMARDMMNRQRRRALAAVVFLP
jgi:hypothetical protein